MFFLLRREIAVDAGNTDLADAEIVAESISIGSSPTQAIKISGQGVAAEHATLIVKNAALHIVCKAGNRVELNGKKSKQSALVEGDTIQIGSWFIDIIESPAGFDAAVLLRGDNALDQTQVLPHATVGLPSLRALSYLLLFTVLAFGLVTPILSSLDKNVAGVPGDAFFSSGPLHNAHQIPELQGDCTVCHAKPFQRVADTACESCHKNIHAHGTVGLQSDLPDAVGAETNTLERCASCHREHNEPHSLTLTNSAFCTDCHDDLQGVTPDGEKFGAVASFSKLFHPEFSVNVLQLGLLNDNAARWHEKRLSLLSSPVESSNLKFNHLVHLDGSMVSDLTSNEALNCTSCHKLANEEHFETMSMETTCRSCHTLSMEAFGQERRLPHGEPSQVIATIEEYYISKFVKQSEGLLDDEPNERRRLPGHRIKRTATCTGKPVDCGIEAAKSAVNDHFMVSGCVTCHEVSESGSPDRLDRWQVQPVRLGTDWNKYARFNHKAHLPRGADDNRSCLKCHNADISETSTDVLMPSITTCLECHDSLAEQKVGLECTDCHGFHSSEDLVEAILSDNFKEMLEEG